MSSNWLDDFVASQSEFECPKSFIRWAGLVAISAIVKKNVYLDRFAYKVYPNIYVMLVGPPGIKKSFATNLTKMLLEATGGTRIISGQSSIEGIIKKMSQAITTADDNPPVTDAQVCLIANELSNLVIENPQALTILLELYDSIYNREWIKTLSEKEFKLKNPCVTMFTASNVSHFNDKIRSVDIQGGFIGRTMVVMEREVNRRNALIRPPKNIFNLELTCDRLRKISTLSGEFKFEGDIVAIKFEKWYNEFMESVREDETGMYQRMDDHIIKIAMLLSLAERDDLMISENIRKEATEICMNLVSNIKNITAGVGISDISQKQVAFMQILCSQPDFKMERSQMLRKGWGNFDTHDLNRITETLVGATLIEAQYVGSKTYYVMTDKATIEFMKAKEN